MVRTTKIMGLLIGGLLWASPVRASEPAQPVLSLTYEQALDMARADAPTLAVARARVAESESQVDAAGVWRLNPRIQANIGPRFGADGTDIQASVRATQAIETGGQRGRRVDAAQAHAEASAARSEDAQRLLLRDVSLTFVEALYWRERIEIAANKLELARAAEGVARRRHELGDVGGLEESSASLAVAHAKVEVERARAALDQIEGQLAALLGVDAGTGVDAVGELRELALADAATQGDVDARPDLRALEADAREAEAMAAVGRSERAPDLTLGVGYVREESEDVVLGIVGISLPIFDRGQGEVAVAEARDARVSAEIDAVRNTAKVEANTADALVQRTSAAALEFERDGLAQLERTSRLTTLGYEKGAVAYDEVLVVRLELVSAMIDYTDLLRAAATARVQQAAATGGEALQ